MDVVLLLGIQWGELVVILVHSYPMMFIVQPLFGEPNTCRIECNLLFLAGLGQHAVLFLAK